MSNPPTGRPDEQTADRARDQRTNRGAADVPDVGAAEDDRNVRVVDRRWWARSDGADDGHGTRSDKPSYIEELEKKLADKDELLKDYAAKYRTAATEFDETRARLRKEVAKDVDRERRTVLASFLEVVDNLDRAIAASREAATGNPGALAMLQGVEMVRQQFLATLNTYGVVPIDASCQPFDPNLHDAVSTVPVTDASQNSVVIDVVKPGYSISDDVLRPAVVTVGKLTPDSA